MIEQAMAPNIGVEGQRRIRLWEKSERAPAFVRVLSFQHAKDCNNCAGYGVILISFCKYGPSDQPLSQKKASTFFSGNARFGKGWYLIEQTLGIQCPACLGRSGLMGGRHG